MTDRATRIADKVFSALKSYKRDDHTFIHALVKEAVYKVAEEDRMMEPNEILGDLTYTGAVAAGGRTTSLPDITYEDAFAADVLEPLVDRALEAVEVVEGQCQAVQQGDEKFCAACGGLRWAVGKEIPPAAKCVVDNIDIT